MNDLIAFVVALGLAALAHRLEDALRDLDDESHHPHDP